ncbi:PTS cellobiose transporter subunit IIC [Lachnospiraceae bacterium 54-53]
MNVMDRFEKRLIPFAESVSKNKYLNALRDGFTIILPLLVIGSFFCLIANFPVAAWTDFLISVRIGDTNLQSVLSIPTTATMSLMAVFIVFGIGFHYAKEEKAGGIECGFTSLMSWLLLMPFSITYIPEDGPADFAGYAVSGIPMDWLGAKGIFIGIICAFASVKIYKYVLDKKWVIKMPAGVPPTVSKAFSALIPISFVTVVFVAVRIIFALTPWENAFSFVYNFLQIPLMHVGGSVVADALVFLFAHLLWFFGIHGTNVTGSVYNAILMTLSAENLAAFQNGLELPNIVNQQFQDLFATYGGAGSTLALVIAMLMFGNSKRTRQLGKLCLFPGIFGINEPVIFGLPIVLNPIMAIPFMLVPIINIICTYLVMKIGIVPITNGVALPWTTPPIISGFLATDWRGALFQAVMLAVNVVIYMPFAKVIDKTYLKEETELRTEEGDSEDISFDDFNMDDL